MDIEATQVGEVAATTSKVLVGRPQWMVEKHHARDARAKQDARLQCNFGTWVELKTKGERTVREVVNYFRPTGCASGSKLPVATKPCNPLRNPFAGLVLLSKYFGAIRSLACC